MKSAGGDDLAALAGTARVVATPCGRGKMVWRSWGAGEPLVLLHGGSGSWRHWLRNIAFFARWREVWCPDLPGMGESDLPDPPVDFDAVAAVLRGGLQSLFGARPAMDLVGFSFGGIAGAVAALGAGLPLRQIVVAGCTALGTPHPGTQLLPWKDEKDPGRRAEILRQNLGALMLAKVDPADEVTLRIYTEDLERARFNSRHTAGTTLLRDALPQLGARVAGIWGAHDATVNGQPGRAEAAIRAVVPDLRFHVVSEAGHWVQYEQPQRFNEALAAVLPA